MSESQIKRIKRITRIICFALNNMALVFSAIMVSNRIYAAPAGRDSEIAPTGWQKAVYGTREIPLGVGFDLKSDGVGLASTK